MNLINKAYYTVMTEGDAHGQPFTFPIPTVNITEEFDWYGENTDILFENVRNAFQLHLKRLFLVLFV